MGAFSNGRPASAGGTGQAPSWHSSGTQSALARAAGANPLLAANPSFLAGGGGGRYASFGQQGGGSAPSTGYGALARGGAGGRPEGYWGPKPGAGGNGGGFSQPSSRDVWTPSGTSGFVGKQPKGSGSYGAAASPNKKPKPAAGATKDGSPWAPPLRRVVVAAPAMHAMRAAADAPTPPGLLDTPDFHGASSVPDLAHLDKKAGEDTKDHGGHYVRSSLFAPAAPRTEGRTVPFGGLCRCSSTARP